MIGQMRALPSIGVGGLSPQMTLTSAGKAIQTLGKTTMQPQVRLFCDIDLQMRPLGYANYSELHSCKIGDLSYGLLNAFFKARRRRSLFLPVFVIKSRRLSSTF